jgi:hypothetical protein
LNFISWSWKEVTDAEGNRYTVKVVSAEKKFNSYEQAEAFIRANPDYIIVGDNPFISPVPLEALVHYELIHKSPNPALTRGNETISYVEIFKYSP